MFSSTVFLWGIAFALIGGVIATLIIWVRKNQIVTKWYDWLIGAIGIILLIFTIQNSYASAMEWAPTAVWMWLVVTGIPSLMLITISVQLVLRRNRTT